LQIEKSMYVIENKETVLALLLLLLTSGTERWPREAGLIRSAGDVTRGMVTRKRYLVTLFI
jgi:hypothetical protein